ncbi:MAG: polyprenyl synthetase family protein [Thaumarchaeota archaeon]|nr:polyprenyl synthetase family protein [Nitrososphaerota archaeon]
MELRDIGGNDAQREKTDQYLSQIEEAIRRELQKHVESRFHGPLTYAVEGGKLIRPLLLLFAGEAVGNRNEDLLPAAVAIELLHTESITHDDIIDEETSRRNRVVFHVKYGYGASLLTADFVFGMILEIASRYGDPRVAQELSTAALRMCEGELWELKIDPGVYKISKEEYIQIISLKTASLFQAATKLGAIIGGGSEEEISALSSYGLQLGIAYQIQDDLLDWEREGKITSSLILNSKKDDDILSQMRRMAKSYTAKAKQELMVLKDSGSRSYLEALAEFSSERLQ